MASKQSREVVEEMAALSQDMFGRNGTEEVSADQSADEDSPQESPEQDDPWDVSRLRLAQDFTSERGTKVVTRVAVKRPNRQEYFRVRGGEDWRLTTRVLRHEESREDYLVDPLLWASLELETKPVTLFTAITRGGKVFLWPCAVPSIDRPNLWHQTALDAALRAIQAWVRLTPDQDSGQYDLFVAEYDFIPDWPALSFKELLKLAFQDRFIRSLDHPVVQQLHGRR